MPVQQHGLYLRQDTVFLVQVTPPSLHHSDSGIRKEINRANKKIARRKEVRVEYGDQFARGCFQTFLKGASLEAAAVGTMPVFDWHAGGAQLVTKAFGVRVC